MLNLNDVSVAHCRLAHPPARRLTSKTAAVQGCVPFSESDSPNLKTVPVPAGSPHRGVQVTRGGWADRPVAGSCGQTATQTGCAAATLAQDSDEP